jgi:hypothetical protein
MARLRLVAGQRLQLLGFSAAGKRVVQFVRDIEMVLDYRLVAARDEDEMLDSGSLRFVHDVLDHRTVHDVHHLLRDGLGGGQESGAEAGDRKDGFANALHRGAMFSVGRTGWKRG